MNNNYDYDYYPRPASGCGWLIVGFIGLVGLFVLICVLVGMHHEAQFHKELDAASTHSVKDSVFIETSIADQSGIPVDSSFLTKILRAYDSMFKSHWIDSSTKGYIPTYADTPDGMFIGIHFSIRPSGTFLYDSLGCLIRTEKGHCDSIEMIYDGGNDEWVPYSECSYCKLIGKYGIIDTSRLDTGVIGVSPGKGSIGFSGVQIVDSEGPLCMWGERMAQEPRCAISEGDYSHTFEKFLESKFNQQKFNFNAQTC